MCLAEGVLRGWDITGTAEAHYKMGVKESFAYWGAGGADAYLANSTGLPTNYDDPKETGELMILRLELQTLLLGMKQQVMKLS